jgi:DNA-binding CsgD family transcriptional regulator
VFTRRFTFHPRFTLPLFTIPFLLFCWAGVTWLIASGVRIASGPRLWFLVPGFMLLAACSLATTVDVIRRLRRPGSATSFSGFSSTHGFSRREQEVCSLLMKGYSNMRIGEELFISLPTVKSHVYSIFRKTGVHNRAELLFLFRERSGAGD